MPHPGPPAAAGELGSILHFAKRRESLRLGRATIDRPALFRFKVRVAFEALHAFTFISPIIASIGDDHMVHRSARGASNFAKILTVSQRSPPSLAYLYRHCRPGPPLTDKRGTERPAEAKAAGKAASQSAKAPLKLPKRYPARSAQIGPKSKVLQFNRKLERAKGFEPSTPTLARLCSTPELRPLWRLETGRFQRVRRAISTGFLTRQPLIVHFLRRVGISPEIPT